MNDNLLAAVHRYTAVHADRAGLARTPLPGLTTVRSNAPSDLTHAISRPIVCLVLQGHKQVTMGAETFDFGAGDSLLLPESHLGRVARAVAVVRAEFARPLRVERLAAVAGMSPSSFFQHFRAVTSLSPLQFQKQLRLIEARRLMMSEGLAASSATYAVGYESVPQFTRDYGRMFGLPPATDRIRQTGITGRVDQGQRGRLRTTPLVTV